MGAVIEQTQLSPLDRTLLSNPRHSEVWAVLAEGVETLHADAASALRACLVAVPAANSRREYRAVPGVRLFVADIVSGGGWSEKTDRVDRQVAVMNRMLENTGSK